VHEVRPDGVTRSEWDPQAFGIAPASIDDLAGGDAAHNAAIVRAVLAGKTGPVRDIAVYNAAAALLVAGLARDISEGMQQAAAAIDDGRAQGALDALVATSRAAAERA
jgi:anthranilate phosphoribosyltransferase